MTSFVIETMPNVDDSGTKSPTFAVAKKNPVSQKDPKAFEIFIKGSGAPIPNDITLGAVV